MAPSLMMVIGLGKKVLHKVMRPEDGPFHSGFLNLLLDLVMPNADPKPLSDSEAPNADSFTDMRNAGFAARPQWRCAATLTVSSLMLGISKQRFGTFECRG